MQPPCSVSDKPSIQRRGCYEVIGYSSQWDYSRNRRSNQGDDKKDSGLLTTTRTPGKALNYASALNNTWLVDYGATDHMTFDSRQVTSLQPTIPKFYFHSQW